MLTGIDKLMAVGFDEEMAAAIWHNHKPGTPVLRSLTAFDH